MVRAALRYVANAKGVGSLEVQEVGHFLKHLSDFGILHDSVLDTMSRSCISRVGGASRRAGPGGVTNTAGIKPAARRNASRVLRSA